MKDTSRPPAKVEGPATNCVIDGKAIGWTNCTPTAGAMVVYVASFGAHDVSGCVIRRETGDTVGGTTLPQVAAAIYRLFGIKLEVRSGGTATTPQYVARQMRVGRCSIIQIGTRPLLSFPAIRSTRGAINHAVGLFDVRGGTYEEPNEALIGDPAADGHVASWGRSPSQELRWWPWHLVKQAMGALQPWGEDDSRTLGPGKCYAAIAPLPHVSYRYGGRHITTTATFPDRALVRFGGSNLRSRPDRLGSATVVRKLVDGELFPIYQRAAGVVPPGNKSNVWYGDHTGTRWVYSGNLKAVGGAE